MSLVQHSVVAEPARPETKRDLAALNLQQGQYDAARALLKQHAEEEIEEARESSALRAVAAALGGGADGEARRLAQKAVMLRPAERRNWKILALHRKLCQPAGVRHSEAGL
jgi:superkiller protein 3